MDDVARKLEVLRTRCEEQGRPALSVKALVYEKSWACPQGTGTLTVPRHLIGTLQGVGDGAAGIA